VGFQMSAQGANLFRGHIANAVLRRNGVKVAHEPELVGHTCSHPKAAIWGPFAVRSKKGFHKGPRGSPLHC